MNFRNLKKLDYIIVIIVLFLISIGLIALYSATYDIKNEATDFVKQLFWVIPCIIVMFLVASIDYNNYAKYGVYIYFATLGVLVAVLFTNPINGASSWFNIRGISIQPAEFAKVVIILTLAKHLERIKSVNPLGIDRFKNLFFILMHIGIPILLILEQPDAGTAMVFMVILVTMLFVAGIDYKYIKFSAILSVILLPITYFFILSQYQQNRIKVFLNPNLDPRGAGYHVLQSKLAIGSGQTTGMGLLNGIQTQMGLIPEKTTDFIFSVVGEEMGFVFCVLIVILFIVLLLKIFHISRTSKDLYGSYIAAGIGAMMTFHFLENVGMTMGLLPVTGIPLPFISYGGSSLLTNMIAIGILLSVSSKRSRI